MGLEFTLLGERVSILPVYHRERIDLEIDGRIVRANLEELGEGRYLAEVDNVSFPLRIATGGDSIFLHHEGEIYSIEAVNSLELAVAEARDEHVGTVLSAPMPGVVVSISKFQGEWAGRGETILTVESMKLQTPIVALRSGRIAQINVQVGESFEKGDILVTLKEEDSVL